MGIEAKPQSPQVIESTHPTFPIWRIWAQNFAHLLHGLALRVAHHMTVDPPA